MLAKTYEFKRWLFACAPGETVDSAPVATTTTGKKAVSLRRLLIPVTSCLPLSPLSSGSRTRQVVSCSKRCPHGSVRHAGKFDAADLPATKAGGGELPAHRRRGDIDLRDRPA